MPTLLRLALATIAVVGATTTPILLILTGTDTVHSVTIVIQMIGVCALWFPPAAAGSIVSAWSPSDQDSSRRLRRVLSVCGAIALAGAIALISSAALAGDPVLPAVVASAVGLAVFPASIAIGGAARRSEERHEVPDVDPNEHLAAVDADISRGRRRGLVGGGIGLVLALVVDAAVGLAFRGEDTRLLQLVGFAVAFAALGVSIGRITVSFQLAQRSREVLGTDYGAARRIGRVIRGRVAPASPDEEMRAARYARLAMRTVPFQSRSSLLSMVAICAMQLPTVVDEGLDPIRILTFALVVATLVVVLPFQVWQVGRIRRFALAHPADATARPA